jgi:hypothetical protein
MYQTKFYKDFKEIYHVCKGYLPNNTGWELQAIHHSGRKIALA